MQITWPWPSAGRFSHDLITLRQTEMWTWSCAIVWEFYCSHFTEYISMSPNDIHCKQTWCKKIYHMKRVSWLNPLWLTDTHTWVCYTGPGNSAKPLNLIYDISRSLLISHWNFSNPSINFANIVLENGINALEKYWNFLLPRQN